MELDELLSIPQSRRRFLQIAGASLLAAGPSAAWAQSGTKLTGPLSWYAFGTAYSNPALLDPWNKATGVEIRETPWTGADEMTTKMRAGGSSLFDTASIPQQFVKLFAQQKLIEPVDLAAVPNYAKLFPEFAESAYVKFDGRVWGVPWIWGANAIAFDKRQIPDVTSIATLFDPKYRGRISMRDDPEDSLAVAAFYLGIEKPYSMTDAQLQEVKKVLLKQRPLIRAYWKSPSDLQTLFANKEIAVAWSQLVILAPLRAGGVDMGWVWPKEGVLGFFNGECVVRGTAKKPEALAFANYLIGPDYGVLLAEKTGYATTSGLAAAKMAPDLLTKAGIDPKRLKLLKFKELIPNRAAWQKVWDEVKAG